MSETTEQWLARIGSREAMEARQMKRLDGDLNAPLKGARGLAAVVRELGGRKEHPLTCKCIVCIPDWLREDMKTWPKVTPGMYNAIPRTVTVIKSKDQAPKKRRSKWEKRGTSGN